jgi:hypothetical protein
MLPVIPKNVPTRSVGTAGWNRKGKNPLPLGSGDDRLGSRGLLDFDQLDFKDEGLIRADVFA